MRADAVTRDQLISKTPTLDTGNAYANGDVMAITAELCDIPLNAIANVNSVFITNKDKTATRSMEIWILRSNTSLGALNAAENLADGSMDEVLTIIPIAADDYEDAANWSYVSKNLSDTGVAFGLKPTAASAGKLYYALKYADATGDAYSDGDIHIHFWIGCNLVSKP